MPLVSWCFTSMRGHSHCDYGSAQNTEKLLGDHMQDQTHTIREVWLKFKPGLFTMFTSLTQRITNLRWDILGGLNPDCGVPFSRRQDSHLIEELVDPREEICSVLCLVCHIMEDLYNEYYWKLLCLCNMMFNCSQQRQKFTLWSRRWQCTRWNITRTTCMCKSMFWYSVV